ncbi:hypothetical protein Tcan_11986 [Toxocara canis]|uniref:Uncharacterized protein n=1 Tax=Toxocara canis TaxID=6265 RepID=A0A0B2UVK6_TOXCA|nr:hypothetical protein Tcan_11986 [Toxocara canis]
MSTAFYGHELQVSGNTLAVQTGTPESVTVASQPLVCTTSVTLANDSAQRRSGPTWRTLRKNQWRLFKHTAFFSSSSSVKKPKSDVDDHTQRIDLTCARKMMIPGTIR